MRVLVVFVTCVLVVCFVFVSLLLKKSAYNELEVGRIQGELTLQCGPQGINALFHCLMR